MISKSAHYGTTLCKATRHFGKADVGTPDKIMDEPVSTTRHDRLDPSQRGFVVTIFVALLHLFWAAAVCQVRILTLFI